MPLKTVRTFRSFLHIYLHNTSKIVPSSPEFFQNKLHWNYDNLTKASGMLNFRTEQWQTLPVFILPLLSSRTSFLRVSIAPRALPTFCNILIRFITYTRIIPADDQANGKLQYELSNQLIYWYHWAWILHSSHNIIFRQHQYSVVIIRHASLINDFLNTCTLLQETLKLLLLDSTQTIILG